MFMFTDVLNLFTVGFIKTRTQSNWTDLSSQCTKKVNVFAPKCQEGLCGRTAFYVPGTGVFRRV